MKYLAIGILFAVGNEILSYITLLIMAGMFLGDIVKEAA